MSLDRRVPEQDSTQNEELTRRAKDKRDKENYEAAVKENERQNAEIDKQNVLIEKTNAEAEAKYQADVLAYNKEKTRVEDGRKEVNTKFDKQEQSLSLQYQESVNTINATRPEVDKRYGVYSDSAKRELDRAGSQYSALSTYNTQERVRALNQYEFKMAYPNAVLNQQISQAFKSSDYNTSLTGIYEKYQGSYAAQAERSRQNALQNAGLIHSGVKQTRTQSKLPYVQPVTQSKSPLYTPEMQKRVDAIKPTQVSPGTIFPRTPTVAQKQVGTLTNVNTGQYIDNFNRPQTNVVANPRALVAGLKRQVAPEGTPILPPIIIGESKREPEKIRVESITWTNKEDPKISAMVNAFGYDKTNQVIGNYNRIIDSNNIIIRAENRKNKIAYAKERYKNWKSLQKDDPYFASRLTQGPIKPKYETAVGPFGSLQYMVQTEQLQPINPKTENNPFGSFVKGLENTAKSYEYLGRNLVETVQGKELIANPSPPIQDDFFGSLTDSAKQRKIKPLEEFSERQSKRDPLTIGGEIALEAGIFALPVIGPYISRGKFVVKTTLVSVSTLLGKKQPFIAGKLSKYEIQQIKQKSKIYEKINAKEIKEKQKAYNKLSGKQKEQLSKHVYANMYGQYSRQRLDLLKYEKEFGQGKYDNLDFDTRVKNGKRIDSIDMFRKSVTPETVKISQEMENRPPLPKKDDKIDYDVLYGLDRPPQNYHAFIGESKSLRGIFQGTRQEIGSGVGLSKDNPIKIKPPVKPRDTSFSKRWDIIEKSKPDGDYLRTTNSNNMQQLLAKPKTIQKQQEKSIQKTEQLIKEPEKPKKKQKVVPYLTQVSNVEYQQEESYVQKIKGVQKLSFVVIPRLQSKQSSRLKTQTKLLSVQKAQTKQLTKQESLLKSIQVERITQKQKQPVKQKYIQKYTPLSISIITPVQILPQITQTKTKIISLLKLKIPTKYPKIPLLIIPDIPNPRRPTPSPGKTPIPFAWPKEEKKTPIKRTYQPGDKADFLGNTSETQVAGLFNRLETTYGLKKISRLRRGDKRELAGRSRSAPRRPAKFVEGKSKDPFGFKDNTKKGKKFRISF